LVQTREDARQDQQRARQRLGKFVLRYGCRPPADVKKNWTNKYLDWTKRQVSFDQPAQAACTKSNMPPTGCSVWRKPSTMCSPPLPAEILEVVRALQALRGVAPTGRRQRGRRTRVVVVQRFTAVNGL
jgi:hypothetical protein